MKLFTDLNLGKFASYVRLGCGMGPLDRLDFPFVIVDEAAQVSALAKRVLSPMGT